MHRFGARVRKRKRAVCQRSLPDRDASLHRAMLLRLRQSRLSNELITCVRAKLFENIFTRLQWQRKKTLSVELEQVECVEVNGRFPHFHLACLQKLKRGAALLVERDHFAVDHAFMRRQPLYRLDNLRETSR